MSSPSPQAGPKSDELLWQHLLDLLVKQADQQEQETEELLAVVGAPEGLELPEALGILLSKKPKDALLLLRKNNPQLRDLKRVYSLSEEEQLKVLLRVLESPTS